MPCDWAWNSKLAESTETAYLVGGMNAAAEISEPPRIPAPPELIARAEALVKKYEIDCFWFRHPEAKVRYLDDVRLVVHHLREYGDHNAWRAAQEIQRCL